MELWIQRLFQILHFILRTVTSLQTYEQTGFVMISDHELEGTRMIGTYSRPTSISCAMLCHTDDCCKSIFYHDDSDNCTLHEDTFYSAQSPPETETDWQVFRVSEVNSLCIWKRGVCMQPFECTGNDTVAFTDLQCNRCPGDVCCIDKKNFVTSWNGYYVQDNVQNAMSLETRLYQNEVTGIGSDIVSTFSISGTWEPTTFQIVFLKFYAAYNITYTGVISADLCNLSGIWSVLIYSGAFNFTSNECF